MSELQRYGIEWTGPKTPICVAKDDGYWTPWHVAEAELAAVRAGSESAHAAQRHAETELSQYMAWYAMAEQQHLHEQRRAEKAEAEAARLRAAGEAALRTLENVAVFVTTKERIHRPSGEEWFEGCVKALRAALAQEGGETDEPAQFSTLIAKCLDLSTDQGGA